MIWGRPSAWCVAVSLHRVNTQVRQSGEERGAVSVADSINSLVLVISIPCHWGCNFSGKIRLRKKSGKVVVKIGNIFIAFSTAALP